MFSGAALSRIDKRIVYPVPTNSVLQEAPEIQTSDAPALCRFGLWGKGLCRVSAQKGYGSFSLNLHTRPIVRAWEQDLQTFAKLKNPQS